MQARKYCVPLVVGLSVSWLGAAQAKKPTTADSCSLQKSKISAQYFSCLYKRDFTTRGNPNSNAHGNCETTFKRFWVKIESANADANGNTLCPLAPGDEGLTSEQRAQNVIDALKESYTSYSDHFKGLTPVPDPSFVPPPELPPGPPAP